MEVSQNSSTPQIVSLVRNRAPLFAHVQVIKCIPGGSRQTRRELSVCFGELLSPRWLTRYRNRDLWYLSMHRVLLPLVFALAPGAALSSTPLSPLRKLAISQATSAANQIVETNYLLDPTGVCSGPDCAQARDAALVQKKAWLPVKTRAAIARWRLAAAKKLMAMDDVRVARALLRPWPVTLALLAAVLCTVRRLL